MSERKKRDVCLREKRKVQKLRALTSLPDLGPLPSTHTVTPIT